MRWIYVNGELVRRDEARVSALDRGLLHGYGLFETMRSYGRRAFRLERHYHRLCEGAALLGMGVPLSPAQLSDAVEAVLDRNGLTDAYLRLTVTAGEAAGRPSVLLSGREPDSYPAEMYRRGAAAVLSPVRRNESSPLSGVKSLSYLDNVLAREEARRSGADEALVLNTRGFLAEGSASNVFLVVDGRLVTPELDSGALPGVTREAVMEVAPAAGLEAVEADVTPPDLERAAEAFLTSSLMEVMPLVSLDGRPLGDGWPGPTTERLGALYRELVERETGSSAPRV